MAAVGGSRVETQGDKLECHWQCPWTPFPTDTPERQSQGVNKCLRIQRKYDDFSLNI